MEKYLITGASGFVSKYFLDYLNENNIKASVLGIDMEFPEFSTNNFRSIHFNFKKINLLNKQDVAEAIKAFKPDYILHLASYSSVAYSWKNPVESFTNNTNIFLNLIEEVRRNNIKCRILSVGSSEEYGNVKEEDLPLVEHSNLVPVSPYAVARVSQEMLSKVFIKGFDMDIIMSRSFNHIGPGQKDIFVISSFAKQLIEFKEGKRKSIVTGDPFIVRDFVDVRDVVKAYYMLFKKGKKGEVYNICSGAGVSLQTIMNKMADILDITIHPEIDTELIRPDDNKKIIGSNEKIKRETGWKNDIPLEKSLVDVLKYYQDIGHPVVKENINTH